jgi:transcriptional regulator with XRE-family HTH domain
MSDIITQTTLQELARREMSIKDLSVRSKVGRSTLSRWLSGRRSIRVCQLARVMDALGLRIVAQEHGHARGKHDQGHDCPRTH